VGVGVSVLPLMGKSLIVYRFPMNKTSAESPTSTRLNKTPGVLRGNVAGMHMLWGIYVVTDTRFGCVDG
jgi:hypothetical protein